MFEEVSRSLKYDSNFFLIHKHIPIFIHILTIVFPGANMKYMPIIHCSYSMVFLFHVLVGMHIVSSYF